MTLGDLIKIFPAIASWAAGAFLIFFSILPIENFLHPRVKVYLSKRLKNPSAALPYRWLISKLLRTFDRIFIFKKSVFGLLLPSLFRSALVTVVLSFTLVLLLKNYYGSAAFFLSIVFDTPVRGLPAGFPNEGVFLFELRGREMFFKDENRKIMLSAFIVFSTIGILVDYIALVETRISYEKMLRSSSKQKLFLLIFDILIKLTLAIVGITIAYILNQFLFSAFFDIGNAASVSFGSVSATVQWGDQVFREMVAQLLCSARSYEYCSADRYKEYPVLFIYSTLAFPFFLSTFFTSIWVWIYLMAFSIFRIFYALRPIHWFIDFLIDIEKEPFKAVALVLFFFWTIWFSIGWIVPW